MTTDQIVPVLLSMLDGIDAIHAKPIETMNMTDGLGTALRISLSVGVGALLGQIVLTKSDRYETVANTAVTWFVSLLFVWGGYQILHGWDGFDERHREIAMAESDITAWFGSVGGCDAFLGGIRAGEIEALDARIEDFLLSNCGTRAVEQAVASPASQFRWEYRSGA